MWTTSFVTQVDPWIVCVTTISLCHLHHRVFPAQAHLAYARSVYQAYLISSTKTFSLHLAALFISVPEDQTLERRRCSATDPCPRLHRVVAGSGMHLLAWKVSQHPSDHRPHRCHPTSTQRIMKPNCHLQQSLQIAAQSHSQVKATVSEQVKATVSEHQELCHGHHSTLRCHRAATNAVRSVLVLL